MRDYKKIKAYQLADELCVAIYKATKEFPKEELYGLTSQVRRAAVSVAANIVEGASRNTAKDYCHFLYIARGSLAELQYLISLSVQLGYLGLDKSKNLVEKAENAAKTLFGLITSVQAEVK
jgi:four helix bundle protein